MKNGIFVFCFVFCEWIWTEKINWNESVLLIYLLLPFSWSLYKLQLCIVEQKYTWMNVKCLAPNEQSDSLLSFRISLNVKMRFVISTFDSAQKKGREEASRREKMGNRGKSDDSQVITDFDSSPVHNALALLMHYLYYLLIFSYFNIENEANSK